MPERFERVTVLGDGAWGTTLAIVLANNGVRTTLWSAFPEQAAALANDRANEAFLPGVALPDALEVSADPFSAVEGAELVVSVVPTQYLRGVAERFEEAIKGDVFVVTATKGLEIETFSRPSRILREVLGDRPTAVLSGPSHAEEVARGMPASVVVASEDGDLARRAQASFGGDVLRVYTHADPVGAELAGALKNVIALAAGISDGLGLGDNAKSALLTRGVVEMARFGKAHGASAETFFGLAGIGDLMTTCFSPHGRNRAVGERIGRGDSLEQILGDTRSVAEGVWTTQALFGPESEDARMTMPIASEVYAVLFEGKSPRAAVTDLMRRDATDEMAGVLPELD